MNVPDDFGTVTPYVLVDGVDAYAWFLQDAFGAEETGRSVLPDGRIANCQLRFSGTTIMLGEASEVSPASRAAFYLFVSDADAAMRRAERAGAVRAMDVADMPYGDRQGGVRDPAGTLWWVSQRMTTEPYVPPAATAS